MHETHFPESTALHSAAYDEETEELTVRLRTGRTYVYHGVPEFEYDRLVSADSAGQYYNHRIKDEYPFSEIIHYERSPAPPARPIANPPSRRRIDFSRSSRARRPQSPRVRRI
jgi:KTSC domain